MDMDALSGGGPCPCCCLLKATTARSPHDFQELQLSRIRCNIQRLHGLAGLREAASRRSHSDSSPAPCCQRSPMRTGRWNVEAKAWRQQHRHAWLRERLKRAVSTVLFEQPSMVVRLEREPVPSRRLHLATNVRCDVARARIKARGQSSGGLARTVDLRRVHGLLRNGGGPQLPDPCHLLDSGCGRTFANRLTTTRRDWSRIFHLDPNRHVSRSSSSHEHTQSKSTPQRGRPCAMP